MASPDLEGAFKIGYDILNTSVDARTKKILVQLGDVHRETTDTDNAEWWQQVGLASRPPRPQKGKAAAQAATLTAGDHDVVFASQDMRGLELYGNLADGETCLYAPGEDGEGQARILLKKDGSISLYTRKGNAKTGTGMVVQVDAENGAIRLLNDRGFGIIIDSDGIKLTTGAAGISLESGGNINIVGTARTQVDGSTVVLGSLAVPGLNSALTGITGLVGVASTKVFIATVAALLVVGSVAAPAFALFA
jgi:hypothetical protein